MFAYRDTLLPGELGSALRLSPQTQNVVKETDRTRDLEGPQTPGDNRNFTLHPPGLSLVRCKTVRELQPKCLLNLPV